MTLHVKAMVSLSADDPAAKAIQRMTRGGEKSTKGVKRALTRYNQLIDNTQASAATIVRDFAMALESTRLRLLGGMEYPPRERVCEAIKSSTVDVEIRQKLIRYINEISYAEYARLVESAENFYRMSG